MTRKPFGTSKSFQQGRIYIRLIYKTNHFPSSNEKVEFDIKNQSYIYVSIQKKNYFLDINLAKYVQDLRGKLQNSNDIRELNKWRDIPHSWIRRL